MLAGAALAVGLGAAAMAEPFNSLPANGVVPDEQTAIRIAEAVLTPIYGADKIKGEEPFRAKLFNGTWTVEGTLHCAGEYDPLPPGVVGRRCAGGVAIVDISRIDGRVTRIEHER